MFGEHRHSVRRTGEQQIMTNTEIDPYPVSQLTTRFGIGRTALYDRINALNIVPTKQGSKSFVTKEQLHRLDELDEHLKEGGAIADFERVPHSSGLSGEQGEQDYSNSSKSFPGKLSNSEGNGILHFLNMDIPSLAVVAREVLIDPLINGIKDVLRSVFPAPLSRTERGLRLSHLRELEDSYEKGWLLSTSELADLLGLTVNTVRSYGEEFEQAGFTFTRSQVTTRSRGQIAWQVGKMKKMNAALDVDATTVD